MDRASKQGSGSLFLDAQHQLRQPLNAISLLIGELRDAADGRDRAAIIEDLRYALQLSNAWLDSLTDLEKAERGLLQLQVQNVPLHQVFARLREDFAGHFAQCGLGFRVVDSHAVVRADPGMLRRLIALLLDNAAKFTRQGRVLLGCRRAGDRLRIEVWDSGLGVAEAEQARLFDPFYRLENEVRPRERGLGLGLTYARRLAAIAGDQLSVASALGKGSCFALTLRRAAPGTPPGQRKQGGVAVAAAVAAPAGSAATAPAGPPDRLPADPMAGTTVLLLAGAEAETLRGSLEAWSARVTVVHAADLGEGLRAGPALLLADQAMLEASGAADLLRQEADPPALILVVDRLFAGEVAAALPAARVHYLERPVRPARLRSLCHYALTRR